jgi:SPP1 family predicted phage head-tail adaptor
MVTTSKLTERLEIQQLVLSATTYGEGVETWQTVRVIYGTQTAQKGKLYKNNFDQYDMDFIEFYCRYTPLLRKGTRILYKGDAYKIYNLNTVTRKQATVITLIN